MAILTFPVQLPSNADWQLVSNTQTFKSPINGTVQTSESPGARWHVSLAFPKATPAEGRIMVAFLASLRGEAGRFYLWDHTQPTPRGTITGVPVVQGAAQIGASILTSGWTGTLLAGDMIGIGGELKMVITDVAGAGATPVAVAFEPPLRASPASGSVIATNKPTAVFKLTGDNQAAWKVSPILYAMNLVCEEAF